MWDRFRGEASGWVWPGLIALAGALICLPFTRSLYGLGDEGILLHGAARMARGQGLYRDFFELHPPLGFLIVRWWTIFAGPSLLAARLLSVCALAGIAAFTALACVRAGSGRWLAAGLTLAWLVMSQGVWTMVNHHWFTTLFAAVALWAILKPVDAGRDAGRSPLAAGFAVGAAVMTTPPRGVLAGLAAAGALLGGPGTIRRLALLGAGAAVVPLLCLAWVASQGALAAAVQDLLVFPATQYSGVQAVPWGDRGNIQNGLVPLVFPVALLLAVVVVWRQRGSLLADRRLCTTFLFAATGLVGCFPRPDAVHIAFAAPLALPLLAQCVQRLGEASPPLYRRVAVLLAAIACVPSLIAYGVVVGRSLPAPDVASWGATFPLGIDGEAQLAAALAPLPGDAGVLYYPYMPLAPVLAGRVGVTSFDVYVPGYTTPAQYAQACREMMRGAQWVVVNVNWTDPRALKQVFPALRDGDPPEKQAFERALHTGFPLVRREGPFELRRRGPATSETLCEGARR